MTSKFTWGLKIHILFPPYLKDLLLVRKEVASVGLVLGQPVVPLVVLTLRVSKTCCVAVSLSFLKQPILVGLKNLYDGAASCLRQMAKGWFNL